MDTIDDRMDVRQRSLSDTERPAEVAGERLASAASQAGVAAQEQMDRLADAIRRKPVQAAGIAAGIGFVLALLARR